MVSTSSQSINFIGKKHISNTTYYIYNILSMGLVYLICRSFNKIDIAMKTTDCELADADCVVLEDQYKNLKLVRVTKLKVKPTLRLNRYIKDGCCKILDTPYSRFIYDYKSDRFVSPNFSIPVIKEFTEYYQSCLLKSKDEENLEIYERRILFGSNDLGLTIPSCWDVFEKQLFDPLFIWEILSIIIWIKVQYYKYAGIVGAIYAYLFFKGILGDFKNRAELIKNNVITYVRVLRGDRFVEMPETEILPGDMIYIDSTNTFKCDALILKGDVITDESFLTGESVPICKSINSMVYSGTTIIKSTCTSVSLNNFRLEKLVKVKNLIRKPSQIILEESAPNKTDDVAIGLVVKTGKKTKRGLLLKNILVRKPSANIFSIQCASMNLYLSLGSMTVILVIFIYLITHLDIYKTLRYVFDLFATFFGPSLYTALELGAEYSKTELSKKHVITTETDRINTAGEVDMVLFDKTGTLTEVGVDILCLDTIKNSLEEIGCVDFISKLGLSTCHYVIELDNEYSGDILDMKMFLFSKSRIVNKDGKRFVDLSSNNEYTPICKEQSDGSEADSTLFFEGIEKDHKEELVEILKIHDFDLYLKRMSVVVKCPSGSHLLFCKGAPDSLSKILESLPNDYEEKVKEYGLQGYRVLTLAYKVLEEYGKREDDEQKLIFIGFIIFANKLKEETAGVIKELREANIKPKMCTGDNILTAISVARESGMIDHDTPVLFPVVEDNAKSYHDAEWFCVADDDYIFDKVKMQLYMECDRNSSSDFVVAIEGKEFEYFKKTVYHSFILEKGVIFARFNPDNKKDLVEDYSNNNFITMFCGDGANDTGALSSADVGLSLSSNEASLAASFNSQYITGVLDLIKEGRSALAMSAAQFKYVFYSQVLAGIQMVALLFFFYFPCDMFSLINDLMSCYILAYSLSTFKASSKIHPFKISIDLRKDCLNLVFEIIIIFAIFLISSKYCGYSSQTEKINITSRNSTVIFISMMFLLIIRAFLCADFGPHRTNRLESGKFISVILFCTLACSLITYCLLSPINKVVDVFQSAYLDSKDKRLAVICLLSCLGVTFISYSLSKSRISFKSKNHLL